MGAHFSSKHYRRKLTMISKVAVLCVFATLAQAAPEAQWLGHAPVAYAAPDCAHSTQDLVAKTCHPVAKEICTEETAINQKIEYEEVCEDVVSKHCGHPGHVGLIKREAEADPQHLLGHHLPYAIGHHVAPVAVPVAHHAAVTVKHECAEVTTKHCVQSPISSMCPPQSPNATSKNMLNARRSSKNSPRSPVNPSRPPLPSLPMPTMVLLMDTDTTDSSEPTTFPLLLPQLPWQKNKASLQLMIM